jgi:hypothetical protein
MQWVVVKVVMGEQRGMKARHSQSLLTASPTMAARLENVMD